MVASAPAFAIIELTTETTTVSLLAPQAPETVTTYVVVDAGDATGF